MALTITLPPRTDKAKSPTLDNAHQITVIGANGAGKTRFCRYLLSMCGDRAWSMSALHALMGGDNRRGAVPSSIDKLFEEAYNSSPYVKAELNNEFERLIYLLLHDEFLDMLRYKSLAHSLKDSGKEPEPVPKTKLDYVIERWEELFPNNRIMREGGRLFFMSGSGDDRYSSLRLSDGEKAILYYLGAIMYAPKNSVVLVDDPGVFIHRSIMQALWNTIEHLRSDCTFIYNTHDIDFAISRIANHCIWVKSFDAAGNTWDYEMLNSDKNLSDELFVDLLGSRKPVLFIEGDAEHSIDSKLYQLVFNEYTVKPLGSCNRVIESTRTFNDLNNFHHLDSFGIIDRDRRDDREVAYLRKHKILVPDVAEIENIMLLPGVITTVATRKGKDAAEVLSKVKSAIMNRFGYELKAQALQHVRYRVKKTVEVKIDKRFTSIGELETHMSQLLQEINPRATYNEVCRQFHEYRKNDDYMGVLKVYNCKPMLGDCHVAQLCGFDRTEQYMNYVYSVLRGTDADAAAIRTAIKQIFEISTPSE